MMKRYQALVQVAIINYILSWLISNFSIKSHDFSFPKLNFSIELEG